MNSTYRREDSMSGATIVENYGASDEESYMVVVAVPLLTARSWDSAGRRCRVLLCPNENEEHQWVGVSCCC